MGRSDTFTLFGIPIDNVTEEEALQMILENSTGHSGKPSELHYVNAHCMNVSCTDEEYRSILQQATAVFADGSGIRMAGKRFDVEIKANVNGTDMFPRILEAFRDKGLKVFLLGAAPGIAEKTAEWAIRQYGQQVIAGYHDGFFTQEQQSALIDQINASGADLLLIAMGVPRQEKFAHEILESLTIKAVMGVGGLFDFYSGSIKRAPKWMRSLGIEWVYRLIQEPGRMWRRYIIGNILFMMRVRRARRNQGS